MRGRIAIPITIVGAVLVGMLVGCGGSKDASTTRASGQAGGTPGVVIVTAGDNGRQVSLRVGNTMIVRLESNPSTGYGWAPMGTVPDFLTQQGQGSFESGSTGAVGAPGTQSLMFFAAQPGSGTLALAYVRPWENTQPAKTFSAQVDVAP
jgi:inhibitor of cysteine peptidase